MVRVLLVCVFAAFAVVRVDASEKPVVGGRTWVRLGTAPAELKGAFQARVDTGATTTSIDATGFKLDQLTVGQKFSFLLVKRRKKVGDEWVIEDSEDVTAKLEYIKEVNGRNRPFVAVWLQWRNHPPEKIIANLSSRERKHRVLLGRNWIEGKLVDLQEPLEKVFAVNGEHFSDIRQGKLGSCSVLAALASASNSGVEFRHRVKRAEGDSFKVFYYESSAGRQRQTVINLSDGRSLYDPQISFSGDLEWWPVLMQRCFIHSMDSTHRDMKNGSNAVAFISGQPVKRLVTASISVAALQAQVQAAFQMKRTCAIAQTKSNRRSLEKFSRILLSHHAYALIAANDEFVTLYNPHSVDIMRGSSAVIDGRFKDGLSDHYGDDPSDGLLRVRWDVFHANMKGVYISTVKSDPNTVRGN